MKQLPASILLARTDNLGDVVVSLSLAGYLKSLLPTMIIGFVGKKYTQAVVEASPFVDFFFDREDILENPGSRAIYHFEAVIYLFPDHDLGKALRPYIPIRVGTAHRWHHWLTCSHRIFFSRSKSDLHEAELNTFLLKPWLSELPIAKEKLADFAQLKSQEISASVLKTRKRWIIHPKSKGSAREWPLSQYQALIKALPKEEWEVCVTGIQSEGDAIRSACPDFFAAAHVFDYTGKQNLKELIDFIATADVFLACSTGPLHIAAALGVKTIGLFPPLKPMHPGRWAPLGRNVHVLCLKETCESCPMAQDCDCIGGIGVDWVLNVANNP